MNLAIAIGGGFSGFGVLCVDFRRFEDGTGQYFLVGLKPNQIDVWVTEEQASCRGVNLAVATGAGFWVVGVFV